MAERHVSRWRLPAPSSAPSPRDDAPSSAVSLRYLDEFVRKLQCAPRLLEHQLFPDAKEITESMGLFNAVRRYVITGDDDGRDVDQATETALADGIVVVGDGNTPRSAAMFAYRLKQWKCYSIDPAMERPSSSSSSSAPTRASGWESIANLVVVRNKIENVHIKLRRSVVVLVHAHVTLAQALGAVECDELVGVVTMPCCNWYGKQEQLLGRPPSVVYDDFSILSDHRELRVWVDPRGDRSLAATQQPLALDQSAAMAKGCVRKVFVADYGVSKRDHDDAKPSGGKTTQKTRKDAPRAAALFRELLSGTDKSDAGSSSSPRTVYAQIASTSQCEAVATYVETQLETRSARVLVLTGDGPSHRNGVVRSLLQRGFTNVYGLQLVTQDNDSTSLRASVIQLDEASMGDSGSPSSVAELDCATVDDAAEVHSYVTSIVEPGTSEPLALFDCVVDVGFVYRSLRNQSKKTCGLAFERIVQLTTSMTTTAAVAPRSPRLISLSPRKDWRKREFLANERLALAFSTTSIAADAVEGTTALFVYACSPSDSTALIGDRDDPLPVDGDSSSKQSQKKQLALQLKKALEDDFTAQSIDASLSSPADLSKVLAAGDDVGLVCVRGVVQHLRRFTTGPSFFSIAPSSSSSSPSAPSFRDHLQVALDPVRLTRWGTGTDQRLLSLDAVLRLLHKGDRVECVGEMARNAQQQPVLRLDALRFLESEFQAYQ